MGTVGTASRRTTKFDQKISGLRNILQGTHTRTHTRAPTRTHAHREEMDDQNAIGEAIGAGLADDTYDDDEL